MRHSTSSVIYFVLMFNMQRQIQTRMCAFVFVRSLNSRYLNIINAQFSRWISIDTYVCTETKYILCVVYDNVYVYMNYLYHCRIDRSLHKLFRIFLFNWWNNQHTFAYSPVHLFALVNFVLITVQWSTTAWLHKRNKNIVSCGRGKIKQSEHVEIRQFYINIAFVL